MSISTSLRHPCSTDGRLSRHAIICTVQAGVLVQDDHLPPKTVTRTTRASTAYDPRNDSASKSGVASSHHGSTAIFVGGSPRIQAAPVPVSSPNRADERNSLLETPATGRSDTMLGEMGTALGKSGLAGGKGRRGERDRGSLERDHHSNRNKESRWCGMT